MSLQKLEDFDPHHGETFRDDNLKGLDLYAQETNEKIGTISDILVDEAGHFRYLVVAMTFWLFGKKVLLPIGCTQHNHKERRVSVDLSKVQLEAFPEFHDNIAIAQDYGEQARGVDRIDAAVIAPVDTSASLEAPVTLDAATGAAIMTDTIADEPVCPTSNRDPHSYQQPSLDNFDDRGQTIKLYQERLLANKTRRKTGEVKVSKHVETETTQVSVLIEKQRVAIERVTPPNAGKAIAPESVHFGEGEVANMEIYEETPDIYKEAFLREEVRVNKVVEQETVQVQNTIRREELDVNAGGQIVEDKTSR